MVCGGYLLICWAERCMSTCLKAFVMTPVLPYCMLCDFIVATPLE